MIVVPAIDAKLQSYGNDERALFNLGSSAVILSMPTMEDLRTRWREFLEELRNDLHLLWSMPQDQVVQRFGLLGYDQRNVDERGASLYGLAPKTLSEPTSLARVQHVATLAAIVEAGLLPKEECGRTFRRREGLAAFLAGLSSRDQKKFFGALLREDRNLDEIIRLGQGCDLDLHRMEMALGGAASPEAFLRELARAAAENAEIPLHWSKDRPRRWYAPMWFAAYLAREGVWLLPLHHAVHALASFPTWMRPVQLWLSFPRNMREFCNALMRDNLARTKGKQVDPLVVRVAIELAWTSNVWSLGRLCAGPLISYKKHCLSEEGRSREHRSWAVNRLWDAKLNYYGAAADEHPDSHAFVHGKRLVSKGVQPFDWVHSPHKRNLARYRRLYGDSPSDFPDWLKDWAAELERLLPLFQVELISKKIAALDLWLLYLAGLSDPPRSFEQVIRYKHINSAGAPNGICFRNFLSTHFSTSKSVGRDAMATLKQAWSLAAVQNGFGHRLSNPVDQTDSPFEYQTRPARTVRRALDARVAEIIARENIRDDMAFARGLGPKRPCWRIVRLPDSGELIDLFFAAAPTLIHVILHTGMRGKQARWLDSGEGDERIIDFENIASISNPSRLARAGRRQGFLRLCDVIDERRSQVIGMWVNSGKAGPHEVPWVHEDVIAPVRALQEFQARYYPISGPIEIGERDFDDKYKKKKGDSYPLARDPANKVGQPLSEVRLRAYWKSLLEHCQPIVDQEFGYHYSLIAPDGQPRFDIHGLRVTIITTLLENGVPVTVVQMLVGHKSPIMTWYYQDVTNYKIHSALQGLIERRKAGLKDPSSLSEDLVLTLTSEAVTFRTVEDFAGAEMLKEHRQTGAGIDVFSHGICPGGNCEFGGERIVEGRHKPVWRPRACSGCRFRVTGPAFLNGLVQRANSLMWEIKGSMRREVDLNLQIEGEEDAGRPVGHLRSAVYQEHEFRDHLFNEWCLEIRTIRRAEEQMKQQNQSLKNALVTRFDTNEISARWRETHEFELAHRLVRDSLIIQGDIDLPADVLLYRDQILHKIAYANDIGDYFYSLDPRTARKAMDLFGETLIAHTKPTEQLQAVIEGSLLLKDIPRLNEALNEALNGPEEAAMELEAVAR